MTDRVGAWARLAAVVAAVVCLDQAAKAIAVSSLARGQDVNVFLGLDLTHVRNSGVAFGALSEAGALIPILIGAALAGLLAYFARHADAAWMWLPVGWIVGGALGNLADRAREGTVVDFIDPIAWPAFNLADVFVVLGVLGLFYLAEGRARRRGRRGEASPAPS